MITVQQLMDQHNKVLRAKADLDDINFLYPDDGNPERPALREQFFEGAYKHYLEVVKVMKDLMNQAEPAVLAEAKRLAREQQEKK